MRRGKDLASTEVVENKIFLVRGVKVMFDRDLAELYGVWTRDLNKAVSRNSDRFPSDFMFRISKTELEYLMFHFGTSRWGGVRKLPRAFTEQGIAMLSGILRSKRAVHVNIAVMRAFVKLRRMLCAHKDLAEKLSQLEKKYEKHDSQITAVFDAIRQLMTPSPKKTSKIGFLK
jgi:hypothetical protein